MARGKHSAALFEVIKKAEPKPAAAHAPGFFATLFGPKPKRVAATRSVEMPAPAAEVAGEVAAPVRIAPVAHAAVAHAAVAHGTGARGTDRPGMSVDSDRQRISFQLTYTSAAVAVCAVVTAVAAAYLAGTRINAARQTAIAPQTTAQVREGDVAVGVTDLSKGPVVSGEGNDDHADPALASAAGSGAQAADPKPAAPARAPRDRTRAAGLNYLIIQSFPEEKMAIDAVTLLGLNGIECTVEKNLPRWGVPATWYTVVGLDGFSRLSENAQYDAYVHKIREVSDRSTKRGSFKAFDPKAYKWGQK